MDQAKGMTMPLMIGGATTSKRHTAVIGSNNDNEH